MSFYKNKKVLVTGGTGLIGRPLVDKLLSQGAHVKVVSLDDPSRAPKDVEFLKLDLRSYENCEKACKGAEYVFNLIGIKGSPKMMAEKPASYFVPTVLFNTNMMAAAFACEVEKYQYTSSIGVYSPAEVFYEDDVWKTFPSPNDRFAGWAKRMGELQAESYEIEFGWKGVSIVRPANVYGPYDNFDPENAMVIPALIRRATSGENPLVVWGDGSAVRDFIYSEDCAEAMLLVMEKGFNKPVNLGSGTRNTIKDLVSAITACLPNEVKVTWDTSKPTGDNIRVMDTSRLQALGFNCKVSLEEGVSRTIAWFLDNRKISELRFNTWNEGRALASIEMKK